MPRSDSGRRLLRSCVRAHRRPVLLASLLFCGHQAGEALVPVLVGVVIDEAVTTGDPVALITWLAVLGLDFLVLSTSYRLGARQAWAGDVRSDQRLRMMLTRRVLDPAGGAEAGRLPGSLATIATSDTKRIGVVNYALPHLVAAFAALIVAAVSLLVISVPLGLLILLGTPPLLYLVERAGRPIERRAEPSQEHAARASGVAADLVAGIRVLKGIGAERAAAHRYAAINQDALTATLTVTNAHAWYQGTILTANGLFLALIAYVGGRLAADGALTVGGLVSAVGLAQFLVGPLQAIGWANGMFAQGRASATRVADVLATGPAVTSGSRPAPERVRGALRIAHLSHGPLSGLTLDVAAGELVGVVCPDAAAATALLDCLGREVDPPAGTVAVDGVPLTEYPPAVARRLVLVAPHAGQLFAGTVESNVRSAAPDRDPAPALAAARADEVGAKTAVTEQGSSLSGGQRQRVALARALAADPPVLVLHDPTTALDPVTEAQVATALRMLRRDRTTVVVTSNPTLLDVTDRVLVVRDGRIVADGKHAELLDRADYREVVLA